VKSLLVDEVTIVVHSNEFPEPWRNKVYGLKDSHDFVPQQNVDTYKKSLHWREFLKIQDQFLGGIKGGHPGSAGILLFFRWFLLKNLIEQGLLEKYDRFVITRSDYLYKLPHPKVDRMNSNCIWIPNAEHYGGYTYRHAILSKTTIVPYLNILNCLFERSNNYFMKMKSYTEWNLEKLIRFHLEENKIDHLVREFPYVMYTVRSPTGSTRWEKGTFSKELGYCIKYPSEFDKSEYYKTLFESSGLSIDAFYQKIITIRKNYGIQTPVPLYELDPSILEEFKRGFDHVDTSPFLNGVSSNSYHQVPDICKSL